MSEENINIEPSTNEVQTKDSQVPQFEIPTEASELVGSGKKYTSVEDALKSVPHAQKHIQTLESELATLKEELTKRRTTEELLDEIKSGIQPRENLSTGEFDQDKLMKLVDQTIEYKEQQKSAKQNANSVAAKFTEKYGNNAENAYNTVARESGLTTQQLNSLASNTPSLVLKLAGLDNRPSELLGQQSSTVNTQALNQKGDPSQLSARVKQGATTKDLVNAWKIAGEKAKLNLSQ